jgi:hypothetical protein
MRSVAIALLLAATSAFADEPTPIVTDATGKEIALKKWKITGGTRKLSWVDGKPDAFEFRETGSTTFKEGIATLIPLSRLESITWDYEKEAATVRVVGLEKPLVGSTRFRDINVLTIEAEVDQGKSGVAEVRFRGGVIKGGIRGVKFNAAKAAEKPRDAGPSFAFTVPPEGKSKSAPAVHTTQSVQALYRIGAEEKPLSYLMFKKSLKVELVTIAKLSVGTYNAKDRTAECELKLKDGSELSLTLLGTIQVDGKPATLVGLVGSVPAGYRQFPVHTIVEMGEQKE